VLREADDLLEEQDSLIYFKSRDEKWLEKHVLGVEKSPTDVLL
jgi:CRISPR-associated protein Cas2